MKYLMLSVLFLTVINVSIAQNPESARPIPIKVRNWAGKSFLFTDEFWNGKKEQIDAQMGNGSFERVVKYSNFKNIPKQMSISNGASMDVPEDYYKKMSGLKNLTRVATFKHTFQGTDFGKYVVVEVPYQGNENWDSAAKWNIVYFIFEEQDVEAITN